MNYAVLIKIFIASTLFIGLGAWVQLEFGWATILQLWRNVPIGFIILGIALVFSSHMLRVVRIYLAYRSKSAVQFHRVLAVSLVHNTVSFLLPMRLGELALPALSKHQLKIDVSYAAATLVLIRLFDLHILGLLLCFFAGSLWLEGFYLYLIPGLMIIGLPFAIQTLSWAAKTRLKLQFLLPLIDTTQRWLKLYAISVGIWGVKLFAFAYLVSLLGEIAIDHAWLATIIADGSALSPVTGFANTGTFEAAFTLPLIPLGYNVDQLLPVAVNLHLFIFITNIAAGIIGLLFLRKNSDTSGN